jgi:hypothetical protein
MSGQKSIDAAATEIVKNLPAQVVKWRFMVESPLGE